MSQESQENSTSTGASASVETSADKSADKAKKPLKIGKIVVDRNLCIGAASCIAVAPGVFELDFLS